MKHPEAPTSPLKIDIKATEELVDGLIARGGKKVADIIPKPAGYKLLIVLPKFETKIGSIELPDNVIENHGAAFAVALVKRMGDLAYADKTKFPEGPWCKIDDFIMINKYAGTRFKIKGHEMRLINDDEVEAVIQDPTAIERA